MVPRSPLPAAGNSTRRAQRPARFVPAACRSLTVDFRPEACASRGDPWLAFDGGCVACALLSASLACFRLSSTTPGRGTGPPSALASEPLSAGLASGVACLFCLPDALFWHGVRLAEPRDRARPRRSVRFGPTPSAHVPLQRCPLNSRCLRPSPPAPGSSGCPPASAAPAFALLLPLRCSPSVFRRSWLPPDPSSPSEPTPPVLAV